MADDDKDSKTEEPTGKKLEDVRNEGNVAQSQEVKSFAMLAAGLLIIATLGPWIASRVGTLSLTFLERPHAITLTPESLQHLVISVTTDLLLILAIPFATFTFISVMASIVQFGWLMTASKLKPDINKINPITGVKKMFSVRQLAEGLKGIVKLVLVTAIAWIVLTPYLGSPETMMAQPILRTLQDLYEILMILLAAVCVVMAIIAVADFSFQSWKHKDDNKMTKQEVKDEHKNTEGDPQVKARIRKLRMKRMMERMMSNVPDASVVVTNPTHYAVALKYDMESMQAPILVAKGQDNVALRIREKAENHEVPIVENPPLARALHATVELDQEVPPEHYKAVAEVISYVMKLKKVTSG